MNNAMYKICVYVPPSHLQDVKDALFSAGAGRIGNYQECCWQMLGEGQFKPSTDAHPYQGQIGQLEKTPEYRLEVVCAERCIHSAIAALLSAHPYEQPAYDLLQIVDI